MTGTKPLFALCGLAATLLLAACDKSPSPPAAPASPPQTEGPPTASLTVEGSAFVLKMADGRMLRGTELAGATVYLAAGGDAVAPLKLVSIVPDDERPDILRHDFQVPDGVGWLTVSGL